ncbi:hypothetical protein Tco_0262003 [Tanacetum coccineum]
MYNTLISSPNHKQKWIHIITQLLLLQNFQFLTLEKFGDSYKAPPEETGKGVTGEGSAKKKGRTVAITVEDMQKWRNDVKARTTLLLALPDEHQLRFSKYDNAKELWEAILKTFGGNEATKKTKKNQLKQQYGNFKAEGSETLKQTFNRLQAIVSHLEFMDVPIKQDDLNQKFLSSLAPEWLVYTIVWRNRDDLIRFKPLIGFCVGLDCQHGTFVAGKDSGGGGKGLTMGELGLQERDRGEFVEMAKVAPHGYMRLCSHGPCVVITFGDLAKQVPKSYNTLCKNRPWWYKLGTLAALALVV